MGAQVANGGFPKRVLGYGADHRRLITEASEGDRHIALSPANADIEAVALKQKLAAGCGKAKQKLPKTDDFHAASA
jgi:ABC-type Zn2+ transport system substrate-binding protein/surface adhesin